MAELEAPFRAIFGAENTQELEKRVHNKWGIVGAKMLADHESEFMQAWMGHAEKTIKLAENHVPCKHEHCRAWEFGTAFMFYYLTGWEAALKTIAEHEPS
jgi:hypothetical protein